MRLHSPFVAGLISLVFVLPFLLFVFHAPGTFEAGFLNAGRALAEQTAPVFAGEYPPGVPAIYAILRILFGSISVPFAATFQALLFAVGAGCWFLTLGSFFTKRTQQWLAWTASLLNPYFLWLIVTSKDTAFEWLGVSAFFFFLTRLRTKPTPEKRQFFLLSAGLIGSFVFAMMMRVTTVFVLGGSLLIALFIHWRTCKKQLAIIGLICVTFVGLFVLYNGRTHGSYSLTTTTSLNIAYGQSPLYEYAHPQHDIDVFLPPVTDGSPFKNSPFTLIAISVRKSVWYWLNFEKVPNLSSNTRVIAQTDKTLTLSLDPIHHLPNLLYTLMKLIYLPAFIISLFLWIRQKAWTDPSLVFLVPLMALWPICVLTFPDTRFKIVGEVIAVGFIAYQISREYNVKTSV